MPALLRPQYLIAHALVIAIAVGFVSLGLWQLRRHAEVADRNDQIAQQVASAPLPLPQALALAPDDRDLRPVRASGEWLQDADVQLSPRSRNGRPGFHVLTPLLLDDGSTVLADRGWVPLDEEPPPAPGGEVAIQGRLRTAQDQQQVIRDDAGAVTSMRAVAPAVLASQVRDLRPDVWVEVVDEEARLAGRIPRPAPPVELDGGNHLSYAFQWFAFTLIGLVGYPLLLRRRLAASGDGGGGSGGGGSGEGGVGDGGAGAPGHPSRPHPGGQPVASPRS